MIAAAYDIDTRLMLGVREGDSTAFEPLVKRNYGRVMRLARRMGAEPEDAAQETFLRVYQARERYEPRRRFDAYLMRIATNHCISSKRRRRPHLTEKGDVQPVSFEQPVASLLDHELRTRVRSAVRRLPARQREAIELRRFEGLSQDEVARRLGLTVPATKSLLHRARQGLKTMLETFEAS